MDHSLKAYGKKTWLIPDTFLSSVSGKGEQPSHEAICVINTSGCDAHIKMTLLFEQKEALQGFCAEPHNRLDKAGYIDSISPCLSVFPPQRQDYSSLETDNSAELRAFLT